MRVRELQRTVDEERQMEALKNAISKYKGLIKLYTRTGFPNKVAEYKKKLQRERNSLNRIGRKGIV